MATASNPAMALEQVGPGRPPAHSRFKPGVSGNPKGRPLKQRDLKKLVEQELDQSIWLTEGGRRVRLTKREIIAKKLVNAAASGDDKALATLIKLGGTSVETIDPYSAMDAGQVAAFLARHLSVASGTADSGLNEQDRGSDDLGDGGSA